MTEPRDIDIRIRHVSEGLDAIQKSIAKQRELGGDTRELQDAFDELQAEMADISATEALIDSYEQTRSALEQTRRETERQAAELADLQERLAQARKQQENASRSQADAAQALRTATDAANAYKVELAELRAEKARVQGAIKDEKAELQSLKSALDQAAEPTDELTQAVEEQRTAVADLEARKQDLTEAIAQQRVESTKANQTRQAAAATERDLSREVKASTSEVNRSEKAIERLEKTQKRSTQQAERQAAELDELTTELESAGVEVNDLAAAEGNLVNRTQAAERGLASLQDTVERTGGSLTRLRSGISRFGVFLANLSVETLIGGLRAARDAASGLLGRIVDLGSSSEEVEVSLTRLTGSQEMAAKTMEELRRISRETGTQFDRNVETFRTLKNFGLDPLDGTLQAIIDQTAALGGSQERAERITLALGQAYAKGRLQAEEMLQLVEAGVPVFDLLTQATGRSAAEIQELGRQGLLGRDVIQQLIGAIGEANEGAAAEFAKTFAGIRQRFSTFVSDFLRDIGESGFVETLGEQFQRVNEFIDTNQERFAALADRVSQSLSDITKGLGDFALGALESFLSVDEAITKFSSRAREQIGQLNSGLTTFVGTLQVFGAGIKAAFNGATLVVSAFGVAATTVWSTILSGLELVFSKVPGLGPMFAKARDVMAEVSRSLKDGIQTDLQDLTDAGQMFAKGIENIGGQSKQTAADVEESTAKMESAFSKASLELQKADENLDAIGQRLAELAANDMPLGDLPQQADTAREKVAELNAKFRELAAAMSETQAADALEQAQARLADINDEISDLQAKGDPFDELATEAAATRQEIDLLQTRLKFLADAKENAAASADSLGQSLRGLKDDAAGVEDAFSALGVKSSAALQQAADEAKAAFEVIRRSSTSTQADVDAAFESMAQKALEAAAAQGDSALEVEAGQLRVKAATDAQTQAVDTLVRKYPQLAEESTKANKQTEESADDAAEATRGVGRAAAESATQAQAAAAGLNAVLGGTRARLASLSESAASAFDAGLVQLDRMTKGFNEFGSAAVAMGQQIEASFQGQVAEVARLTQALGSAEQVSVGLVKQAQFAAAAFNLLDGQQLSGLNSAIQQAQQNLRQLRQEAFDTAADINDRLLRATGQNRALEEADARNDLVALFQQREEAERAGDEVAAAALSRAIDQLRGALVAELQAGADDRIEQLSGERRDTEAELERSRSEGDTARVRELQDRLQDLSARIGEAEAERRGALARVARLQGEARAAVPDFDFNNSSPFSFIPTARNQAAQDQLDGSSIAQRLSSGFSLTPAIAPPSNPATTANQSTSRRVSVDLNVGGQNFTGQFDEGTADSLVQALEQAGGRTVG